jgi:hypothetical protein
MALCNADTLLSQACDSKFLQLAQSDPKMATAVLLQLLCNLSAAASSGNTTLTGSGSPVGVVTPVAVGQLFTDPTTPGLYVANGLTNTSWVQLV